MKAVYFEGAKGENVIYKEIPEEYMAQAEEYRAKMLDQAATYDDDLLMKVLEGEEVTEEEINEAFKKAANVTLGYTEDEIVSSDVIGIRYGSLFDATQTKVIESDGVKLVKVAAWYDNEMSYTSQMIRTAKYLIDIMEE